MSLRRFVVGLVVLLLVPMLPVGGAVSAAPPPATFYGLVPARLLDTRVGSSTVDGLFVGGGPVGPHGVINVTIVNRGGVPATGVGAVALNVTGIGTAHSYVTVWPTGATQPNSSNLNLRPGALALPNMVIVPLGSGGQISLYNDVGNTELLIDVLGWYPTTASFTGLVPARLMDTRQGGSTIDGQFAGQGSIGFHTVTNVNILNRGGVPATGVGAVALNVTATSPTQNSFVTVWPTGATRPNASNLNLQVGVTTPNMVIVAVGTDGKVSLYNDVGNTDLIVDVLGWFPAFQSFAGLVPARVMDTRPGGSTVDHLFEGGGTVGNASTTNVTISNRGGVPASGVGSVALNITVTDSIGNGYVTVWPTGEAQPLSSNLNLRPGLTSANMVIVALGAGGQISLFNEIGTVNFIVDVLGWFPSTTVGPATIRASVDSAGAEATDGDSTQASISGDGRYVAFSSDATDLVPDDTNGQRDVFVHDRLTGTTTRVSVDKNGVEAEFGGSEAPSISADGRYVAFQSDAANVGEFDTNGLTDIFVHDLLTGDTTRVNVDQSGNQAGGGPSENPAISADGRYIAYESGADNLLNVSGPDSNSAVDVFVFDTKAFDDTRTTRVSVQTGGAQASGGGSYYPAISNDGRYISYHSFATDLLGPGNDTNSNWDVFVYDRINVTTERVSVDSADNEVAFGGYYSAISGDGRYVVYHSSDPDLVADDNNDAYDIFLYDRVTGETTRVSVDSAGDESEFDQDSEDAAVSSDGRYIAYWSYASNLVADDTNGNSDGFLFDRVTGETTRVSIDAGGADGNGGVQLLDISDNGRSVAFHSDSSDLIGSDGNAHIDIFVRDQGTS